MGGGGGLPKSLCGCPCLPGSWAESGGGLASTMAAVECSECANRIYGEDLWMEGPLYLSAFPTTHA